MSNGNLIQAARSALNDAMDENDRVVILGEDVVTGGPFTLTSGLAERYGPGRVRNTPVSEGAFMGAGVGLALAGGRPFVDIMFNDFITAASDQLFNHAAKIHYMSGGRYSVPLTVWTVAGASRRWGAHHSQNLAGWFSQVPGLKVLSPVTPRMMYSSVREALADPNPVVLLVDRSLLYSRNVLPNDVGSPWKSRIVKPGSDVTVVCAGRSVHFALEAAAEVTASVEVVDLQRLAPLDVGVVLESLERTARAVIAYDEAASGALSSHIESSIYERGFWLLDAPIRRVTSPATPVPVAPILEDAYMMGATDIVSAIKAVLA